MVQKYQNEIAPTFYYGISTKTTEKDLKIPNLQALTLGRIIKMTLYLSLSGVRISPLPGSQAVRCQMQSGELGGAVIFQSAPAMRVLLSSALI